MKIAFLAGGVGHFFGLAEIASFRQAADGDIAIPVPTVLARSATLLDLSEVDVIGGPRVIVVGDLFSRRRGWHAGDFSDTSDWA